MSISFMARSAAAEVGCAIDKPAPSGQACHDGRNNAARSAGVLPPIPEIIAAAICGEVGGRSGLPAVLALTGVEALDHPHQIGQ